MTDPSEPPGLDASSEQAVDAGVAPQQGGEGGAPEARTAPAGAAQARPEVGSVVAAHAYMRHRLHPLELIRMAWWTFRKEPARVIVPALVIFGLDALQSTLFTEVASERFGWEALAGIAVFGASSLGLTFYAGMLERLVGSVERNEAAQPIHVVLRTLPWGRLLLAEVCLFFIDGVAALLVVVPGLVVGTLFALVGPLINLLDVRVGEALRRSVKVVWPHFFLVFLFITLPLALEHEVIVLVADLIPNEKLWAIFLTNFILGDLFGMALGLMEVTLAERLVRGAQGPGLDVRSEDIELPDLTG